MGLMDFLSKPEVQSFAKGYMGARIDRWKAKAEDKQKEIERQAKLNDAIALYKAQQDDIDFRNADKKEKIAIETFNTALAEIGDEAFVNEAKKRGKLKTPQTYDAFKTLWLNFSGNPAIFQDADFRNDWMTNGGAVNINEDEVVNNLTSNDAALAGQKNTGDALIKTKSIPSGVSIQKTPEDEVKDGSNWASKYMKNTTTAQPKEPKYLFDKIENIARDVTVAERLKEPERYRPVAEPEKVTTDLTPFGDSTIYAGIYTVSDKPGQYFTNLQIDPANAETFLQENKGFTVDSLGYVRDVNNKTIPTNVPLNEIRDLEAIDKMDSYQMFDPNKPDQRAMLESFGIAPVVLDNYAKTNKIGQYEIEYVGGMARTTGEPKIIDISIANQKFDTTRTVIERAMNSEMTNYFSSDTLQYLPETQGLSFSMKTGSLDEGRKDFYLSKRESLLTNAINENIAPSAQTIMKTVNTLDDNLKMFVQTYNYTNNPNQDAKNILQQLSSFKGNEENELVQSYLNHYSDSNNLKLVREFFMGLEGDERDLTTLSTYFKNVSQEMFKLIQKAKVEQYMKNQ